MALPTNLPPPPPLSQLRRPALFLDFDGTLVDIASSPGAIDVPATLATGIATLAERVDGRLALISGRALDDLERHLGPITLCRAGSHGSDCRRPDGTSIGHRPLSLPPAAVAALEEFTRGGGADYERKSHGGALHFRARPEIADAVRDFAAGVAADHGLEIKNGKGVVELVWPGAAKGGAVRAFMAEGPFAGSMPVFVGDDLTDEDGMAAAQALGGFGVIVGDRSDTLARYRIATVQGVYEWLEL